MRYADIATLEYVTVTVGSEGQPVESVTTSTAFVNPFNIGASTWMAAQSAGLHADCELQMRACDYNGQQRVTYNGVKYDIERVNICGEFVRLTLNKRLDV